MWGSWKEYKGTRTLFVFCSSHHVFWRIQCLNLLFVVSLARESRKELFTIYKYINMYIRITPKLFIHYDPDHKVSSHDNIAAIIVGLFNGCMQINIAICTSFCILPLGVGHLTEGRPRLSIKQLVLFSPKKQKS